MGIHGIFLIMGNAGCISSTVFLAYIGNHEMEPESHWPRTGDEDLGLCASDFAGANGSIFGMAQKPLR